MKSPGYILFLYIMSMAFTFSCGQKDPAGVGMVGAISVTSEPAGASIFLDGTWTGRVTPDTLTGIPTGQHVVSVSLEGFNSEPQEVVVEVELGEFSTTSFTLSAESISRTVLIEEFSNTSCIPCAEASVILDGLVEEFGIEKIVAIKYHPNFPSPIDPFYLHNPADNSARTSFYGILGIPDLWVDGTLSPPSLDESEVRADIEEELSRPSPLLLDAEYEISGGQYTVRAHVIAAQDPGYSDLVIHFVVVESKIHFDTPPGINGETDFQHIMRKMLPDAAGESFTITKDDALNFERQVTIDDTWNEENIETIVFIQSQESREVLQACSDHE